MLIVFFDPLLLLLRLSPFFFRFEPHYLFTRKLLRVIGELKGIVGFEVVEFAPNGADPDYTAAKRTYKLMNYAFNYSHSR